MLKRMGSKKVQAYCDCAVCKANRELRVHTEVLEITSTTMMKTLLRSLGWKVGETGKVFAEGHTPVRSPRVPKVVSEACLYLTEVN